jgi:hypothetical protein
MKALLSILLLFFLAQSLSAGPPEPPQAPEPPPTSKSRHEITVSASDTAIMNQLNGDLKGMNEKLARLNKIMGDFSDSIKIKDLTIDNDSITIILSNDSVISFMGGAMPSISHDDNSLVNVGHTYTVKENDVVNGNIVNVGADVVVDGKVNGSVMTIGGDIYVSSTGYIRDGAVALSGKVKVESGGRVTNVRMALNESRGGSHGSESSVFRVMGAIFLGIYVIWLILAATFTSLMKNNVERVSSVIKARPLKSFLLGYLAYLLAFVAMLILTISILGIPVALVGVPVALFAGMVLAVTSLSNLIGQRVLGEREISFQTFLYGTLVLSGLPGLFFMIQFLSGSLAIMVFSWIMIGLLIFIIAPLGLGAVLTTRFGTRTIPPPENRVAIVSQPPSA